MTLWLFTLIMAAAISTVPWPLVRSHEMQELEN